MNDNFTMKKDRQLDLWNKKNNKCLIRKVRKDHYSIYHLKNLRITVYSIP